LLANIGKFVEEVMIILAVFQAENVLDLDIKFVPSVSMSKPFGARVTGSWWKRAVFTCET
jgi:hypothetical protein